MKKHTSFALFEQQHLELLNFVEDPEQVRNQIEKAIGRLLNSSEPTLTM